jgi:transcription elongation factor Elf1
MVMPKYLDEKLECPVCGTIRLEIPDHADENTRINCSQCDRYLGPWGELQDSLYKQLGDGVFDVKNGRFKRK